MKNNLPMIKQNNKVALQKSKSLMMITNNILLNDDWVQRLWNWADENDVPDLEWIKYETISGGYWSGLPRDKEKLLNLLELNIHGNYITELPKEVCNLNNLTSIHLEVYYLNKLPIKITNLVNLTMICFIGKLLTFPIQLCNLTNLTELCLQENKLEKLPKEIGNLTKLTILDLSFNELIDLPEEICELTNLTELSIGWNKLTKLPENIVNLTELKELNLKYNPNLILTVEQKDWIYELFKNECDVQLDDRYENLYGEFVLARRYEYLDEFNIGREVPITSEMLDDDIPPEITEKLADGILTFDGYLDEVSEYLDKEKFNDLVQKLYDRDEDLGRCFEQNITFSSFADNKLTWTSIATGEDKKMLIAHWGLINMFIKDIFGFETKIINIAVSIE